VLHAVFLSYILEVLHLYKRVGIQRVKDYSFIVFRI
jgi:hypothetical protein